MPKWVSSPRESWLVWWLVGLALVAIYLRIAGLGRIPGVNGDEPFPAVIMLEAAQGNEVGLLTPTHRLLSPIYSTYVLIVHQIAHFNSFALLRSTSAIAGIAALVLAFFLFQRSLGFEVSVILTLLIGASPLAIAFSRLAVEQAISVPLGVAIFAFVFERRWVLSFFTLAFATFCHPANTLLVLLVVIPLVTGVWLNGKLSTSAKRIRTAAIVIPFALLVAVHRLRTGPLPPEDFRVPHSDQPLNALLLLGEYLYGGARMIAGGSVFEYFAATPPSIVDITTTAAVLVGAAALLWFGIKNLRTQRRWFEISFAAALALTLGIIFLHTGELLVMVGEARHATLLIVPLALLAAILASTFIGKQFPAWKSVAVTAGVATLAMTWFQVSYFMKIEETGGGAFHRTYATGPVEPKSAAFQWILKDVKSNPLYGRKTKLQIVTDDWWLFWPFRYLAFPYASIEVLSIGPEANPPLVKSGIETGAYFVGFSGERLDKFLTEIYGEARESQLISIKPPGSTSSPKVMVWRLREHTGAQITQIDKHPPKHRH